MPMPALALIAPMDFISTLVLAHLVGRQLVWPIVYSTVLQLLAKFAMLATIFPARTLATFTESTTAQFTVRQLNASFVSLDTITIRLRINAFKRPLSPIALVIPALPLANSATLRAI